MIIYPHLRGILSALDLMDYYRDLAEFWPAIQIAALFALWQGARRLWAKP
jgi:hypothetical protein